MKKIIQSTTKTILLEKTYHWYNKKLRQKSVRTALTNPLDNQKNSAEQQSSSETTSYIDIRKTSIWQKKQLAYIFIRKTQQNFNKFTLRHEKLYQLEKQSE